MKTAIVYPIILAAGSSIRRLFPPGGSAISQLENPLEIAVANCASIPTPIVVLGCDAAQLARFVPAAAKIVFNRNWRAGQLSSLLAGLRRVPRAAALMLYPVDLVRLTPEVIAKILRGFKNRRRGTEIVMPRNQGCGGHPVIFSAKLRDELRRAGTAREVVYRDPRRLAFVPVATSAIWKDEPL